MTTLVEGAHREALPGIIIGKSGIPAAMLEQTVDNKQDSLGIPIGNPTPVE